MNGVQLTESQYNNLRKGFSHDTINTMTQEMINLLKNDTNISTTKTEKFVKSEVEYFDDQILDTKETIVTKEEYESSSKEKSIITPSNRSSLVGRAYWETAYKKITLEITVGASISSKFVTLTNVWKQIPYTKSYDVLAVAPGATSISFNLNGSRSGYQKWDGNTINYSVGSSNWKLVNGSGIFKKGIGLSQNIVDDTKYSLSNSITVVFVCGQMPFSARGSYQHAISDVTLAQSQNYTLNENGMGNLIDFSSSVWSKYDTTSGLKATLDF